MPPYNGSGSASAASGGSYPASGHTVIESGKFNTLIADLITMLSSVIVKDGQTTTTARIPFAQGISVDDIDEKTSNTGVNIDGLLIKDSAIADTNGNEALLVGTTGSAVNEFTITNAATGNRPRLAATGGDTNIGVSIRPKGTGAGAAVVLEDGNGNEIIIAGPAVASAVNEVTFSNAATGTPPTISATGGDTNIPLRLSPKGTGDIQFTDGTDTSKVVALEASGLSTSTTRTLHAPNQDSGIGIVLATEVASTSGTSIDFTSIPSWAKRITIQFVGVSLSGTASMRVQIGDSGGVETTGYSGSASELSAAAVSTGTYAGSGFDFNTGAAAAVWHGSVVLTLEDSAQFTWVCSGMLANSAAAHIDLTAGSKSLSAALDRVRITSSNGTDTFDAGALNILFE